MPHAKALNTPIINQLLVRFLNCSLTATVADHDIFTDQIIIAICAEGADLFTGTTFQGQRAMRMSVCNWQTNDENIDAIVSGSSVLSPTPPIRLPFRPLRKPVSQRETLLWDM